MLDWELIAYLALANYILSWLVVEGHVLDRPRAAVQRDTPFLRFGGYHLLECRTCVGFWIAVGSCLLARDAAALLPAWALSRLMRSFEREY